MPTELKIAHCPTCEQYFGWRFEEEPDEPRSLTAQEMREIATFDEAMVLCRKHTGIVDSGDLYQTGDGWALKSIDGFIDLLKLECPDHVSRTPFTS
ncbi:hypothetical protein [Nocardia aurea]|uniref:Uncharacterized protein n=1 Tax=Nocardia aurea TaxID=2144174 RepID=A0ABV3G5P1_9NOCA